MKVEDFIGYLAPSEDGGLASVQSPSGWKLKLPASVSLSGVPAEVIDTVKVSIGDRVTVVEYRHPETV